jgi:hypothetical protein
MSGPLAVAAEVPAGHVVAHTHAHEGLHVGDVRRVRQPDQGLNPAVEVAVHHVGASDQDDRAGLAAAEDEQP